LAAKTARDEKTTESWLQPGRLRLLRPTKGSRRAPCQRKTLRAVLTAAFTQYGGETVLVAWVELSVSCVKPGW